MPVTNKRSLPRWVRPVVDAAMALAYVAQMMPQRTGGLYHELAGIALVALMVAHHVLNLGMLRAQWRRRSAHDLLLLGLDVLLACAVATTAVTGVLISQEVVPALAIADLGHVLWPLHVCASYLGFMLVSVHMGLHLPQVRGYMGAKGRPRRPMSPWARAGIALACIALGAWAFVRLNVATRLTFGSSFPDGMTPLPLLVLEFLALCAPFAWLGTVLDRLTKKGHRHA